MGSKGRQPFVDPALLLSGAEQKVPVNCSGVDEAGRGALAGPVVAAAVVFDADVVFPEWLRDSKTLSAVQRERMFIWIQTHAMAVGVGMCSAGIIDRINILQATMIAMSRAVSRLPNSVFDRPIVIDGNRVPVDLKSRATSLVQGDVLVPAISAASIIAKVTRDRIMCALDRKFPMYGFGIHKGYGTALHRRAIQAYGPSSCHRLTFAPCKASVVSIVQNPHDV
jgi:ribonuclease HII